MLRQIVLIDEQACTGCGLCVHACHEGAIVLREGKAHLIRDDYCDGLGNCLPVCPAGAISFEMREAAAYDEEAVRLNQAQRRQQRLESSDHDHVGEKTTSVSELRQWPVQIKLVPAAAPYFHHARLLIAADCTAYACGDFHHRYMREKVTLIGCTKLDAVDYAEKLTEIFRQNDLQDITVVRMDVPCCGGMEHAVREAISRSGRQIPCHVITLGRDGRELRPDFTLSSLS